MSDYNWRDHWQANRRDGMRVVEVSDPAIDCVKVVIWNYKTNDYETYHIYERGRYFRDGESVRDLLPIVRAPVLIPWTQETFPLGCWLTNTRRQEVWPHGRVFDSGIMIGTTPWSWEELKINWQHTVDVMAPRVWLPCGTLETTT